jgi:predicted nuclease of predicted toxin-antitoxin system
MRFLLDANMPACAVKIIQNSGGMVLSLRDMGLGSAPDSLVAEIAKRESALLVTRDCDFADIRNYPPSEFAGIIVLNMPEKTLAPQICALLKAFLDRPQVESEISRRLAVVRPGRVRFRPRLP